MVDEIKDAKPSPKPKDVTLRAFEIKNVNISKPSSEAKSILLKKLESVKIAKDRCMQLNNDDPNKEKDLISYYKNSDASSSIFCTMLRISTENDIQHVTDTLFEKETFTMEDIATAHIDTSAICKGHYYFSLSDNFVVTNLPLNKTIARLQTYIGWFTDNELFELTPMISPKDKTRLSDLKGIVVKDPEPLAISSGTANSDGNTTSPNSLSTESHKKVHLGQQVLDIIRKSLSDTKTLDDITLSQMISAELLIKFKKPRKMSDEEYKRVLGAYLKPVSDLENISFKRTDNKTEIKGKDLLKTKRVSIETTASGKIVEQQLLKQMSAFLVELSDEKNRSK
ncbi:hypothetical protein [Pantoea agglomerans]|uniref:hypothetical protein n=1 Tax=Enterobacter agglomerans TaxID=549 RepID=UPI003208E684